MSFDLPSFIFGITSGISVVFICSLISVIIEEHRS